MRDSGPSRHWLDIAAGWCALAIPLSLTLLRLSSSTQWRDDLPIVRGLGLVPVGGEGVLSSVLMQCMALLPIGGRLLRAALVSAVGLALAARLLYAVVRRLLDQVKVTPRLTPPLALAATLTATLCPTWQLEGTIGGGATLAVVLALSAVLLRPDARVGDARVWLGFGALLAGTALESRAIGLALLVGLGAQVLVLAEIPTRRQLALLLVGGVSVALIWLLPLALRPLASRAWVDLGYDLRFADVVPIDNAASRPGALGAWLAEVGIISSLLALGGGAWGLLRKRTRWLAITLAAFVAIDLVWPASRSGVLVADPAAGVRLLAVASLAAFAALLVQSLAVSVSHTRVPFARPAAALLVVFNFTLVLMTAEDSSYVADRRSQIAAEVWTDEALASLPPRSMLLVRSEAVAWRLWAARVVRGDRPDLVVVPVPLLSRGSVASRLLALEQTLKPLIREVAVEGRPSEYALSTLADARPLFVELDPKWDRVLLEHLAPSSLWLSFSAHPLGRSDREASLHSERRSFERVLAAAKNPSYRDDATLAVLHARARDQLAVLGVMGDRKAASSVLAVMREIDPNEPFVQLFQERMKQKQRGRIDLLSQLR